MGRTRMLAEDHHDVFGELVLRANDPHDLAPALDRQSSGSRDLGHVDRRKLRRGDDSALLKLLIDVKLPLSNEHCGGEAAKLGAAAAASPRDVLMIRPGRDIL